MARLGLLGHGCFPSSVPFIELQRSSVLRGANRLGKCFCPSRAPQRGGNHKGRGTPLPFVQSCLLLAGVARATGAARRTCGHNTRGDH